MFAACLIAWLALCVCGQVHAGICEDIKKLEIRKTRQHPRVFSPDWRPADQIKDTTPDLSSLYVYWWGDSTLRQIFASFMVRAQATRQTENNYYQSLKECPPQPHRVAWVPPPGDLAPCQLNEQTCTALPVLDKSLFGKQVNLTWDWKHLMYEDYDRWRIDSWIKGEERVPDIVVVGPGHHDCKHALDKTDFHIQQMHLLMRHLSRLPPKTQLHSLMHHMSRLPSKTQVLFIDMVPYTAAVEKVFCYQRVNEAMLDMLTKDDEAAYGSTGSAWLFRRSTPMIKSHVPPTTHHGKTVLNSVTKFLMSHLACIATTVRRVG